jgi:hypothetical protein
MQFTGMPTTKKVFQSNLKTLMNELKRCTIRWEEYVAWVATFTDQELLDLPLASGEAGFSAQDVAYIRSAVLGMKNVVHSYHNESKEGTDSPEYFIELVADPVVF